jgi:hypothetical protein
MTPASWWRALRSPGARETEVAGLLEQIRNHDAKPLDELIQLGSAALDHPVKRTLRHHSNPRRTLRLIVILPALRFLFVYKLCY